MSTNAALKKKKPNNIGRWITTLTPKERFDLIQRATRAQWGPRKKPPKKAGDGPWTWPIDIERYDRSPTLTPTEKETLTRYAESYRFYRYGRTMDFGVALDRLVRPLNDTFDYTGIKTIERRYTLFFFLREVKHRIANNPKKQRERDINSGSFFGRV